MASEAARPRALRIRTVLLALAVALPLALAGFAYWLLATPAGARSVLAFGTARTAGALDAQGVSGRLIGPLQIEHLTLDSGGTRLAFESVRLDWSPRELLQGRLHVFELRAARMRLVNKIERKSEPPRLPERLDLPLPVRVDRLQVDTGEIAWGALDLIKLGGFAFQLDFDGERYRLALQRLAASSDAFSGALNGEAELAARKPFQLRGNFSTRAETQWRGRALQADAKLGLGGSLAEIIVNLDLALAQAQLKGNTRLRPFSDQALGMSDVAARALDLSAFDPAWPQTALDGALAIDGSGAGRLSLSNAAAGTLDQHKLPLNSLQVGFRQEGGQLLMQQISAALGSRREPAGKLSGSAAYAQGALQLALKLDAVNLKRLDPHWRATHLAGRADLKHGGGKQQWAVALSEPLGRQRLMLDAHGTLADNALSIESAHLQAGVGQVDVSGRIDLSGRQEFSAQGRLLQFRSRELVNLAQWPALDLSGEFSLKGRRQPQLEADLKFKLGNSVLAGHALQGEGEVQLRADRLLVPKLLLAAGANRLQAQGSLAQGDTRLRFALDAPDLAQLGPDFGGASTLHGELRGSFTQPRVQLAWNATQLRTPGALQIAASQGKADVTLDRRQALPVEAAELEGSASGVRAGAFGLERLALSLHGAPRPAAPLRLVLQAQGLQAQGRRIDDLRATADGTTAQHALEISAAEPKQKWVLAATGGFARIGHGTEWRGSIGKLEGSGRIGVHLAAPAALELSRRQVRLENVRAETGTGYFALDLFTHDGERTVTRGRFEHVQLQQLLSYVEPAPPVKTDLELGGAWNVTLAGRPEIDIKLRRERGDVTVTGNAPTMLGLKTLNASVASAGERLEVRLHADGTQLGRIELDAAARLEGQGTHLRLAPDAALSGTARLDVPSLAWVGPLLMPAVITEGAVQGEFAIGGSFNRPSLNGRIGAQRLRVLLTELGVDLRDGTLDSEFKGDSLMLNNLSFRSGQGRLSASGPISLSEGKPKVQLAVKAEQYALLNRADRRLVISGASNVAWSEGQAKLAGAVTVESAAIDIGRAETPRLSEDVVIVGRERANSAKKSAFALDLTVTLGNEVKLSGRGLDATLAGQLHLTSARNGQLEANGSLRVAKGSYAAYGRELAIEQGYLRFSGSLANPALDILAMRRHKLQTISQQQVDAGVSVRGTVLAPRVSLVSEPVVPDAEKLSWLVLGHGLEASSGTTDLDALQSAAGALLSQGAAAGLQAQVATAFGLDTLSIGANPDNVQERIVTLGKQISTRLYVSYQQGVDAVSKVVLLRYSLSPRLSLEVEAGTRGAFSLFYNIAFD